MTNDITAELAKLHELRGAEFSRQVELIALRREFHPIDNERGIFTVGDNKNDDYENLIQAARKAVEFGYKVYLLPNLKGIRTADFIFEFKGIFVMYDLKTIQGSNSVGTRLLESIGQSNRILLNMATTYNARYLASDIKSYFETNHDALEILIFKGKKKLSISRRFVSNPMFNRLFRRMYEK